MTDIVVTPSLGFVGKEAKDTKSAKCVAERRIERSRDALSIKLVTHSLQWASIVHDSNNLAPAGCHPKYGTRV
jgi:hypothetical protein